MKNNNKVKFVVIRSASSGVGEATARLFRTGAQKL
jgi:NADP-dependent 3-hydroxy acid dehydrogenase YdfG